MANPVRCLVTGLDQLPTERIHVFEAPTPVGLSAMRVATFAADGLVFDGTKKTGHGTISVPGYVSSVPVRWRQADSGVECEPLHLEEAAVVVGQLNRTDGGRVYIEGCGGKSGLNLNEDGSFYMEVRAGQPCEVRAAWNNQGGADLHWGPPVEITPVVGEDAVVELMLPAPE